MISAIRLSLVALYTTAAMAQHVVSARAGTVYFVDGDVTVDSQQIHAGPTSFPVLKEGELLQTARGWAEVLLAPGVFLRLGDQASVRMLDSRLENTEVVLENGTALVEVVEIAKNSRIQIRLGEASTSFKRMGLYRFESKPAAILVFGGEAEVRAGGRQVNARRGAAVHCLEPADFETAAGHGPRGRKKPLPPNPEPGETLTLPDTPLYGTVRAGAWHGVHPQIHGDRGWFAGRTHLPVLHGTLIHLTVERLPDGRDPHRAMWLWHAGPGPLSLDELWRAYLARFDIEHAFKFVKGILGLTAAKVRTPEQADRWARILIAAHAQLLLARPLAADLRRPWEKHPDPARPLAPGRVRRGFRNIRAGLGTPARVAKPSRPGPGRPKGSSKGPAPRYLLPGQAGMPRTANTTLTRRKVKT